MAYKNFTNCTEEEYLNIIYSQDDKNRIKIWFNNVELEDADEYCIRLKGTNNILPNDGSKRFTLDNFVAKEYDLELRNIPEGTIITDQVKISIGTLVDETNQIYEDVPIGIFNIQDTPTTDNDKITIKLRDNRVKFDFKYNAKPLIEAGGGKATYYQILNDICLQAGVINKVGHFNNENIEVGIYDNTINGSTYVSYIAEQSGKIPQIDREGALIFVDLNNDLVMLNENEIVEIENSSKTNINNLELKAKATQSGTPTASEPIPIKTTTGDIVISSSGKNLFDDTDITEGYRLNSSGELRSNSDYFVSNFILSKPNTRYTYSKNDAGGSTYLCEYNENKEFIDYHSVSDSKTITTSANTRYLRLADKLSNIGTEQLEVGEPTIYENYVGDSVEVDLGLLELAKINIYEDKLIYNTTDTNLELNKWYIKKNINKIAIDSSNISIRTSYSNIDYAVIPKPSDFIGYNSYDRDKILAEVGTWISDIDDYNLTTNLGKITGHASKTNWWLGITKNTSLETLQQQLEGKYIYYPAATSTYILLSDSIQEQLNNIINLELNIGYNYISSPVPIVLNYYTGKIPLKISLDVVEKYELSTPYTIERVVYESGIIKYETSSDETLDTLYLDSSNMYISKQEQVESVLEAVEGFEIDSVSTGKVLGNAAIDPYDLIEVYGYYEEDEYGNYNFVADEQTVVFKTLANNTFEYNGVCKNIFETIVGKEERKENVVKNGDETFKNWARAEINNLNAEILITAGKVDSVEGLIIGKEEYNLTKDTTFQEGKKYYIQVNLQYQEYRQYENYDGDRSGNPQELGLYEAIYSYTYTLTEDTEFDGGDYYTYNGETYDIVNPVSLELYELINEEYVLSEDTVFDKDKTYYYLDYQDQYQQYSKNPSELGFYNRIENISGYQLTTDTSFVEEKAYFDKNYDIDEPIPENTIYEQTTTPSIAEQFEGLDSSINEKLKGVQGSIKSVETSVSQLTSDTYTKTQIQSIVNGTGVDGVVVSATISESGTFDKDGLLIQKEDENGNIISDTSGRFNEKGVQVKTKDGNEIFYSGYVDDTRFDIGSRQYQGKTIVYTQNLQSQGETIIGSYCLIQDYEDGTGWFVL